MSLLTRPVDGALMALVEESGRNVQRCGLLLHDLLRDFPERAPLAQDLKVCEQEGDRITHDIIHRLAAFTDSSPLDHEFATPLITGPATLARRGSLPRDPGGAGRPLRR